MIKRYYSKAPMRIGLAGGGTDLKSYSDIHGGIVLNSTINLFCYSIITVDTSKPFEIYLQSLDLNRASFYTSNLMNSSVILLNGVVYYFYDKIPKDCSITVSTYTTVPMGSGLGTSSTLVVSLVACFSEFLNLNYDKMRIAEIAYYIERVLLCQSGGTQDQFAAAHGGFNLYEFGPSNYVGVRALNVSQKFIDWLESSSILYFSGKSRLSSTIIEDQESRLKSNLSGQNEDYLDNMFLMKLNVQNMSEAIHRVDKTSFCNLLMQGWHLKKQMSPYISNENLETLIDTLLGLGAKSIKLSGAGGGGFVFIVADILTRKRIVDYLTNLEGDIFNFNFTNKGVSTWTE